MLQAFFRQDSLDLIPLGVYLVDKAGAVQFHNRRAVEMCGCVDSFRFLLPDGRALVRPIPALRDVLSDGKARSDIELMIERPDGTRVNVLASIGPLFDERGKLIGAIKCFQDITERKRTEQELADTSAAKDSFLAALSHELRTPLAPVLMSASALERDLSVPQKLRDELGMIRHHIELEARLIDDLLDLTRITRGKLELHLQPVDVHALVHQAIQTCCLSDINTKRISVQSQLDAEAHHVQADPARLQQVLWNILKNAVKFTPSGGRVTVRTENIGDEIRISIADTGVGIQPELLPRIFDAFEQGGRDITRRFGGLGLGLAISKAVMDQHHGTLEARSDGSGSGATFAIQLKTIAPTEQPADGQSSDGQTRSLRILLVEDHATTARVLARLLREVSHEVEVTATVKEAVMALERSKFDLLISDLGLPDGSGLDLMTEIVQKHNLKGIALSGYGMDDDIRRSMSAGFIAHLTKPIDFRKLQATISQVVGR